MTKMMTFKISIVFLLASFISWGHPFCVGAADIAQKVKVSGGAGKISSKECLEVQAQPWDKTAFYQEKLDYDISTIQQIEVCFMSKAPGYLGFASVAVQEDGTRKGFGAPIQSVMPDGEYHIYIFDFSHSQMHTGKMSNWEVRFTGDSGTIGLKSIKARSIVNRIADADNLLLGKPHKVSQLMPRSRCILKWEGAEPARTTLRFFDRDMRELPKTSVVLKPENGEIEFTTPEMLIYTTATIDAKGQGVPVVQPIFYQRPFSAAKLDWRGKWIWSHQGSGPDEYNVWFQKEIELEDEPDYGAIATLGDDYVYTYVNEKFLGKHRGWRTSVFYDITKALKKGKNRITVRIQNLNQGAGLVLDGYVRLKNGKDVFFTSDGTWGCDDQSNTDTEIPVDFPKQAVVLGEPATLMPWKNSVGFGYAGPRGRLRPLKLQPGKMEVMVIERPRLEISRMRFRLEKDNGETHTMELTVTPGSGKWRENDTITLEYPFPQVEGGAFKLFIDDCFVAMEGNAPVAVIPPRKEKIGPLKTASLQQGNGRPYLQFGKDKLNGTFWLVPAGAKHEPELEISRGIGFFNQRINSGFQSFWKGDGQYDFTDFDYSVDRMLSFMPNAIFSLIFEVDMPEWWCQAHPDEVITHYAGAPRAHLERQKQTLASRLWIKDAHAPLKALVDHIKQRSYANRIWGISFASGGNWEWFWPNKDAKFKTSWSGYGPADKATFQSYLREKYQTDEMLAKAWAMPGLTFETIEFPDWRRAYSASIGTLYDTSRDQCIIDWLYFRNRALAEALDGLGKIIKQETDGKWMVGAYYGYSIQLADNPTNPLAMSGHNGFVEVAQSPNVDFVHGPSSYERRKTGLAETIMQNWSTWLLHGKMLYVEQDMRTGYFDTETHHVKIYVGGPDTAFESVGQLNRGFGMELATGVFNYWYDINAGAFYEKALYDICREQRDVRDKLPPVKGTTPIETALVLDRDSLYYSRASRESLFNSAMSILLNFNKLAIPYRNLTVQDLLDNSITVPAHKLYIMLPTLVLDQGQRAALMERFQREKATVVWLYAPGAFYPLNGPSAANCADFLGIKVKMTLDNYRPEMTTIPEFGNIKCVNHAANAPWFLAESGFDKVVGSDAKGQPLMVSRKIGDSTHYFTTLMNLPEALYAQIMEHCGVWRYMDTLDDQCWVGNDVFFLYAVTSGRKQPQLPPNCRARAIIGPFKGTLRPGDSFDAVAGLTYGFVVE